MPDGSRKRRHSENKSKREWYAHHRAVRFSQRLPPSDRYRTPRKNESARTPERPDRLGYLQRLFFLRKP